MNQSDSMPSCVYRGVVRIIRFHNILQRTPWNDQEAVARVELEQLDCPEGAERVIENSDLDTYIVVWSDGKENIVKETVLRLPIRDTVSVAKSILTLKLGHPNFRIRAILLRVAGG